MIYNPTLDMVKTLGNALQGDIEHTLGFYEDKYPEVTDDRKAALKKVFDQYDALVGDAVNAVSLSSAPIAFGSGLTVGKIFSAESGSGFKSLLLVFLANAATGASLAGISRMAGMGDATDLVNETISLDKKTLQSIVESEESSQEQKYIAANFLEINAENMRENSRYAALNLIGAGASAYHGYKRNNDSLGWGLAWFLGGAAGAGVGVAQGWTRPVS